MVLFFVLFALYVMSVFICLGGLEKIKSESGPPQWFDVYLCFVPVYNNVIAWLIIMDWIKESRSKSR
jgi:uncharacterized membrane protein YhdT